MKKNKDIILAHNYSKSNFPKIKNDTVCGCFFCLKIFTPSEITEGIIEPDGTYTVLCPYCDMDSVIGDSCGYPISEDFLNRMQKYWFC